MAKLLAIYPELHFPIGVVFRVPDTFNGRRRGTFYFRTSPDGELRGPFQTDRIAKLALQHDQGF